MWLAEDDPEVASPELVGYKFARQAVLADEGFRVPPFVCVPVTVFDQVVGAELDIGPDMAAASSAELIARAAELRQQVLGMALPEQLHNALLARFSEIAGDTGLVAVRACVVARPSEQEAGEDSAEDPFAGLSDSFLYVGSAELAERVVACWASAFNPEAVLYRARRRSAPFAARVAVGVQRMMMGTRSFVAFSRDPRDGSARCVIAAAYGIGEGVVQEKADTDHFFVSRDSGEIAARVVVKTRAVGFDPGRPGDGAVGIPVSSSLSAASVLTDDEVTRIAALSVRIEGIFGAPQDIEGTITEDGLIYLVQARPIALASAREAGGPRACPASPVPWENSNVAESFPGVSCALTFSVARDLYEAAFTDVYRRMGVPARTLRRERHRLRRMVGSLHGRIYYRPDSLYCMHAHIRCFRPLWSTWEQAIGLADAGDRYAARRRGSRLATGCQVAELLVRAVAHRGQTRRFFRWWADYRQRFQDVPALCPHEVVDAYHALWVQVRRRWGVALANSVFLLATTAAIKGLLRRWLPAADRGLFSGMLCGGPENRSVAALRSAISLAETAAASPALRAELTSDADPMERWTRLTADGSSFGAALRAHVRRYGDRGLHDLKLEASTPRQQPWMLLHTLRAYLEQGQNVRASEGTELQIRREAERELRHRCRNPVKRVCLSTLFRMMRALMRNREDARFCRSELIGDCRELLLRLGAELAATGRTTQDRDVLDLTVDEVLGAFEGTLPGADLGALVSVRARERACWTASEPLPARLETHPDEPLAVALRHLQHHPLAAEDAPPPGAADVTSVLTGLASSAGTVRGLAKIVSDPSTDAGQCRDRILVARETDPGWMFLMLTAKALVVERGTLLSHTAITGRVLGIPTVVAVHNATTLIADGSLLEVDGSAGTVRILDGAP